jgi:hypothetical protein
LYPELFSSGEKKLGATYGATKLEGVRNYYSLTPVALWITIVIHIGLLFFCFAFFFIEFLL